MIENIPEEQILLAKVDILRELPQSELEYLASRYPLVRLGKEESLTLGEYRRGVLFLLDGRVRVHEPTFRNQDLTFSVVEGAMMVGQLGSGPRPSRASRVEALEASVLRVVG
jgi:hypothetical protein